MYEVVGDPFKYILRGLLRDFPYNQLTSDLKRMTSKVLPVTVDLIAKYYRAVKVTDLILLRTFSSTMKAILRHLLL
jgi:hypothetical protein